MERNDQTRMARMTDEHQRYNTYFRPGGVAYAGLGDLRRGYVASNLEPEETVPRKSAQPEIQGRRRYSESALRRSLARTRALSEKYGVNFFSRISEEERVEPVTGTYQLAAVVRSQAVARKLGLTHEQTRHIATLRACDPESALTAARLMTCASGAGYSAVTLNVRPERRATAAVRAYVQPVHVPGAVIVGYLSTVTQEARARVTDLGLDHVVSFRSKNLKEVVAHLQQVARKGSDLVPEYMRRYFEEIRLFPVHLSDPDPVLDALRVASKSHRYNLRGHFMFKTGTSHEVFSAHDSEASSVFSDVAPAVPRVHVIGSATYAVGHTRILDGEQLVPDLVYTGKPALQDFPQATHGETLTFHSTRGVQTGLFHAPDRVVGVTSVAGDSGCAYRNASGHIVALHRGWDGFAACVVHPHSARQLQCVEQKGEANLSELVVLSTREKMFLTSLEDSKIPLVESLRRVGLWDASDFAFIHPDDVTDVWCSLLLSWCFVSSVTFEEVRRALLVIIDAAKRADRFGNRQRIFLPYRLGPPNDLSGRSLVGARCGPPVSDRSDQLSTSGSYSFGESITTASSSVTSRSFGRFEPKVKIFISGSGLQAR